MIKVLRRGAAIAMIAAAVVMPNFIFAAGNGEGVAVGHGGQTALIFLWIAVILIAAKLSGIVERFGQPSVLGELVVGVLLGNLGLIGYHGFDQVSQNEIINFLAELGVVILLFQIGLESNIKQMKSVGLPAFMVAIVGVVAPFVLGAYVVGPWLLPDLSSNAYLFLGSALTATSVGITARVFKDLGSLKSKEAQIILGAAVIDDVLGLIILAVVSALVTAGAVSLGVISVIIAKAILFLVGSIILGQLLAGHISKIFSRIQTGVGMKFTLVLSFGLIFAYLAQELGLAPIVGAFAAGLILDPVHFKYFKKPEIVGEMEIIVRDEQNADVKKRISKVLHHYTHKHVEDLIEPIAHLLVPIFFVVTGMNVKLETLFNGSIILIALAITLLAFVTKLAAGLLAGKGVNKLLVGTGMVPRGEVGLIFATIGKTLGVISDEVFSIIVIMVILTTLLSPPMLAMLLKKQNEQSKLKNTGATA
jgi:Kef-type K+ transport system membrane component KefB